MLVKAGRMVGLFALLAGCGASAPHEEAAHATHTPAADEAPAGEGIYRIDPAQSELRLLVYRAGPMARLGHNHVIVNRAMQGWVRFAGDPTAASFDLGIPVAEFVVDDEAARGEEGADFSVPVPEEARAGTRHNMLSASLLDGDDFPRIRLRSVTLSGTPPGMSAKMVLQIAGHDSQLEVPFTLAASPGRITASGDVVLRQTAMGLVPFSVMLGALQVQDEVTVKFKLVALAR